MLSSLLNDRIGNTMATIAVSQMLMDRIDSLIKINKYDVSSLDISSSIGLTINLAQMVGMSYDEIVELITDFLTRNYGETIKTLDKIVRAAMLTALDAMVSCANSPIIGDDLLYGMTASTSNDSIIFEPAATPINISLNTLDIYNLFSKSSPTGDRADYFYGDVPSAITPSMTWMSGDLDAFLWYVINMVEPESDSEAKYALKVIWDDRNKSFKNWLEEEDLSQYSAGEMEGYAPCGETASGYWSFAGDGEAQITKRKQIFRADYNDRTNSISIQFPRETYGKKKIFSFEIPQPGVEDDEKKDAFTYERNRTIYDFNKDYVDNLRIFYTKPIVSAIVRSACNLRFEFSYGGTLSLEEEILRGEISKILTKVIEADDTEIEDCYFTFSNDEYDSLVREAELRRKGISLKTGDTNIGVVYDEKKVMDELDGMTGTATLQERKTIIKNTFTIISSVTGATDDDITTKFNWDGNSFSNNILQLLKNILMQFLEAFLTPRVVLIFLINYKFANGIIPKTPLDFMSAFLKMIWPVIKALVDYFVDFLFSEVLKRLRELIEIYILKLSLEQLDKFKTIVLALIDNCTLNLYIPYWKKTQMIGNIDNVIGADIIETKSTPDKDNC